MPAIVLAFLAGFGGMALAGELLPAGIRDDFYAWQRGVSVPAPWHPTRVDGHHEIYAGKHGFIRSARKADVLLLGNSRSMFAFRPEQVRRFAERTGLRVFHLGFGYYETYRFPLDIIRRHDLRPRMVVVNADEFFLPTLTDLAREAITEGEPPRGALEAWRRATRAFELGTARRAKAVLQPWLPRWGLALPSGRELLRHHRSTVDGSWHFEGFDSRDQLQPLVPAVWAAPDGTSLDVCEKTAVRDFRQEMESRGVTVVLTLVPYPEASREHAERLAEALGAPLVAPRLQGLNIRDDSHLDRESARRFVEAFLDELERLETYRQRFAV